MPPEPKNQTLSVPTAFQQAAETTTVGHGRRSTNIDRWCCL